MKKIPHCKKCLKDGHYSINCRSYSEKPNNSKKSKILEFEVIKTKPKVNRSKLKKQLDKLVKDYVKVRDNYTCQHCHKKVTGTSCQGSHVFSVGSCPQLQFEPLNIKVLCAYCHLRWWHSNPIEATEWFSKTFPDRLKALNELKNTKSKTSTVELQVLIDEYKQKLLTND